MFNFTRKISPLRRFRFSVALTFGIAMLTLAGLLSVIAGQTSRLQLHKNASEQMASIAYQLTDKLDRGMFERYRDIRVAATILQLQGNNLSLDEKRDLIEVLQDTFPDYSWIGLANPDGQVLVSTGRVLEGADVSERPWFINARERPFVGDVHDALLLEPFLSQDTDEPLRLVDVAVPLYAQNGSLDSVLGVHLNWEWAREVYNSLLTDRMVNEEMQLFIVDANGDVLLAPDDTALTVIPESVLSQMNLSNKTAFITPWGDEQYLTGFSRSTGYRDYPGLGWMVIVRQPTTIAFAPARLLIFQILTIGLGLGILFVGIGWLLAGRVAIPIRKIVQVARAIEQGDTSIDIPQLDTSEEIASLSMSLRAMVGKLTQEIADRKQAQSDLEKLNAELEQRVAERTAELTAANKRLQHLDAMKTKLVSDVSHELRNPIASLMTRLYLLEKQPEKRDHHIRSLKEQTSTLKSLVHNILDVSRLELGKDKIQFVACDLNRIVQQTVEAYEPRADLKGITLTLQSEDRLPSVEGEPGQLGQVVTNLIVNAINYTKQGYIKVETVYNVEQQQVGLIVQDSGIGINPDDMEHLFERFYRGKQVSGTDMHGTGLGLSIIKEIVTIHDGSIEIDSVLNQGSTFRIWLPVFVPHPHI